MPLIKAPTASADKIDKILAESGYKEPTKDRNPNMDAQEYLNESGASLHECLDNMVALMQYAETEPVRLKATENNLSIHGVSFKENKEAVPTSINIQINNVSEENQGKLDEVLCPSR